MQPVIQTSFVESNSGMITMVIGTILIAICITGLFHAKNKKHTEFVNYTPTLLTTIGIFGTFLGVVIGLFNFDHTKIDLSISALLFGLKTAFITSLLGLFLSILFKTCQTTLFFEKEEISISEASPEAILSAIKEQTKATSDLKDSLVGNDESTLLGQLKILRADSNDNFKQAFNLQKDQFDAQTLKQQEFADKLWIKLQDFADTLSKSATEEIIAALNNVIADFNQKITEQFGDNFKQLNEAVFKLVEWQENYRVQLEEMKAQYNHGVEAIVKTEGSVASINEHAKSIPQSMDTLTEVMEVNQHQLAELERHLEAFEQMRNKAIEAVPQIQQQVEKTVQDIGAAVNAASTHYTSLLTHSDEYINKHIASSEALLDKFVNSTERGIDAVGTKLISSSENMGKALDLASTEFTNNASRTNESLQSSSDYLADGSDKMKLHISDAVSDLNNNMRDLIEKVVVETRTMSTTFKDANSELAQDTKQARDTFLSTNSEVREQIKRVIEQAAQEQMQQTQRTFVAIEESAKQQLEKTHETVEHQLRMIDQSMQEELTRALQLMANSLGQISNKFAEDYQVLTQQMRRVVEQGATA
ncbi:MotA/TolQ/ExbB proton channel family protein [Pseudoalteromonas piscicida]|uniref:MotA/TolQ/ExbB proton channel family protein n=1 Tax=Pseudoalteromonas piscicida TaxID=43662 RepID=UPI0027E4B02D|nr:MotA/TolQ/ExbB proton channel family protein [Pseudoalteromonas piscicida]WMO15893.1 MotA/TolQ/ExbB proton channel family protein [Pseudoalteromonas piscicida]